MKAIAITIKPQHLVNILNGTKTLEIRKNKNLYNAIKKMIAEEGKATIVAVCSKGGKDLRRGIDYYYISHKNVFDYFEKFNGKVVARFWCDKVEKIYVNDDYTFFTDSLSGQALLNKSKVDDEELMKYFNASVPENKILYCGYAIPIQNLVVFERAKKINELVKYNKNTIVLDNCLIGFGNGSLERLTSAPQNYAWVEVE